MKELINFDSRWIGEHGIGRFAAEVRLADLNFVDIPLNGNPAGKFDVLKLTAYLISKKSLFFTPGYNSPLFFLSRCMITIHDLNHIDLDFNSSFLKKIYYALVLKRACHKSAKIFTVSEFSKQRITEWANISPEKVIVVGNGVSEEFNVSANKYDAGSEYVFVVGNRKKHKNEVLALKAFLLSNIPKETKIIFSGTESEELKQVIDEYEAHSRVIFTGRLSNEKLAMMYRGAICLLFPSLYEGFGLPVIEAMACGTAVVTSNTTSLKEVSGDAACLVDPTDVNSIKDGLNRVYEDKEYRNILIDEGLKQSQKYTWDKVRDKLSSAINIEIKKTNY
ncbi:glycosyltransferase family 1 protein [Erwinia sp. B116]|uniref:glycosyltransferase family 4 protein n=1 Tax=Erwinia sp. B116 TaxID=1561024 RepID=UPI000C77CBF9|nr:glycosyltransferase family 1 protein [Erwinia sp. B116]